MISGTCIGTFTIHKNVTLRGKPVAGHPTPTLDGDGKGTVLTIVHAANVTLNDLRFRAGNALDGGGIAVGVLGQHAHNSIVRLIDTLVTGNTAKIGGGILTRCCHIVILRGA
jgi:nitrous oxidase accessory protein NosD